MDRPAPASKMSETLYPARNQKEQGLSSYRAKHQYFKSEVSNQPNPLRQVSTG